tara:strand:- start:82847 stop:83515 length:669 start_codon:yes stop_codon:yes gene_type:complete
MIKAVIFDLDNTLIDFMKFKRISCEAAINAMIDAGLDVNKDIAMDNLFNLYGIHGLEDPRIFQKFLLKTTNNLDYNILANGIVAYRKVRAGFLEPYPRVLEVLYKLKSKNLKLAIVSDAPRLKAYLRLASMKLTNFFDIVVTFEDTKTLKPSTKPFKVALKQLKLKPEQCLMVGDRPERDIKGAKKLGIKTCFARYGNIKVGKVDSDFEINSIQEILEIFTP